MHCNLNFQFNSKLAMDGGGCCFPEEIIFEILTRVPAKDLIRFKTVCKPWCFLISDRKFVEGHLHWASRAQVELLLISPRSGNFLSIKMQDLHFQTERLKSIPFQEDLQNGRVKLHDSCNGLLLFEKSEEANALILYNPVTHQCQNIPHAPREGAPREGCLIGFLTALVHDDFNDKYRIFSILSKPRHTAYGKCFVYKVGDETFDNDWEMFKFEVTTKPDSDFNVLSPLLFVKNEFYWVTVGCADYDGIEFDGVQLKPCINRSIDSIRWYYLFDKTRQF
ncbi:hypothetical protein AQUCO_01400112v1 [Aquilegia coerulea]|uniref:F-box domain-containing protein n=1 Tax=Aquilegia coerulea TaxID=218851 RepID=A0A2G5DUL6_AQUCA|nr:hypothetical protein AQUCO_01400112v1 [Aquilegia coerulea]